MKAILTAAVLAAGLAAAAPSAAEAKLACYHLKQIEQSLEAQYGEKPQFTGREAKSGESGVEYRLYVNAETGSWSWVGIPAGTEVGCLIFGGTMPDRPAKPAASPATPQAQF